MKRIIIGIVIGVAFTAVGAGLAATSFTTLGSSYGIRCLKDASTKAIYCGKIGGGGYLVGISNYAVVVNDSNGRSVLKRFQP